MKMRTPLPDQIGHLAGLHVLLSSKFQFLLQIKISESSHVLLTASGETSALGHQRPPFQHHHLISRPVVICFPTVLTSHNHHPPFSIHQLLASSLSVPILFEFFYLLGWTQFCSCKFAVSAAMLSTTSMTLIWFLLGRLNLMHWYLQHAHALH